MPGAEVLLSVFHCLLTSEHFVSPFLNKVYYRDNVTIMLSHPKKSTVFCFTWTGGMFALVKLNRGKPKPIPFITVLFCYLLLLNKMILLLSMILASCCLWKWVGAENRQFLQRAFFCIILLHETEDKRNDQLVIDTTVFFNLKLLKKQHFNRTALSD